MIASSLPALPRPAREASVEPGLPALPQLVAALFPEPAAAAGEVLASPAFVSAALMPNGQAGLIFQNSDGIRFKRFSAEQTMDSSILLSSATPFYPQLATFQGELVAGYVDTRGADNGRFIVRISTDNGASWGAEFYPFGAETFNSGGHAPVLASSRDGQLLHFFSSVGTAVPEFRSTVDPGVLSWTASAPAGDSSMRVPTNNNCGASGQECYRAHAYSFMETAVAGRWLYIAKSDAGFGQSGRGTQFGALGGAWSAQIDLGGSGAATGCCGESTATSFLDRAGNIYYVRALSSGENVYFQQSTDNGASWGPRVIAYSADQPSYTTGAPVGLYVPSWSAGEYVFWAGFGGSENAARRIPIWTAPTTYEASGTRRLFGSAGGDPLEQPDAGACCTYAFGKPANAAFSPDPVNLATGTFTTHAADLGLPGRVLGFEFARWYNSADATPGPLGPAWTHTFNWKLTDNGSTVVLRRGDGRQDTFTKNPDGTYVTPPDVFDTLVKNGDATFTLTLPNQVRYELSTIGQLSSIHEPAGNQITLTYTAGNLTTITDTVGRAVTLSYDAQNRLTQVQDPLGRKVTYAYDASGRLATVTDKIGNAAGQNPALHQWKYAYDGATQHLTTITDPDGRIRVTNTYDGQGQVSQQRDALNALSTFVYSAGQTVLADARGHATTYGFDTRMRVLSQSDVVGGSTYTLSYTYDGVGNRTSVTDRNGRRSDFTYDARGNLLTKTDPQIDPQTPRYVTTFTYDATNNLTQVVDARAFVTTLTYAPTTKVLLSVSRQIDATTSAVTKYEYGDPANPGLPTRVISPRGNTGQSPDYAFATNLSYDAQGNLVTRIDADAAKTTFAYDGAGRVASFVDPDGFAIGANPAEHTWSTSYDENDREIRRTDPLGNFITYGYDGAGNRSTLADRRANVTTYAYDANTRLATVSQKPDPAGQPTLVYTTQVTRDPNGNASRITQANGVVTDYAFDPLNRLTAVTTHPTAQTNLTTSYVLDGNGQPTSRTAGDGVAVSYAYDALSRLVSVSAAGLTTINYAYDQSSQRTQMTDGTGTTTYVYDGLGRLTSAAAPNGTLSYAYDRDGNRTTLGYPGAQNLSYAYSPGGRLSSVTDWASRVSSYTYQPSGLVTSLNYPNTMRATYAYDRAQRLTQLTNAVGTSTITQHTYTLDAEGNRTALDEFVSGITPPPSSTWSPSVRVNGDASGSDQTAPTIAIGADGASYLAWEDERSGGTNANIFFSRRDPATGVWGANVKVNNDTGTRKQQAPAIAVDASGNTYAVWQDERTTFLKPDIFFSKRSAVTGLWSTNVKVNDDAAGSVAHTQPRIAVAADGSAVAVWLDLRSGQENIYSARLAAGASTWSANLRVSDNTSATKDSPDVALGPDGSAYAVWHDERPGNNSVFFATLTPGGSAWSANTRLSDEGAQTVAAKPRVAADAAGNLLAVWILTPQQKVRWTRRPAGSSTWPPSQQASSQNGFLADLSLAQAADGRAVAVWTEGSPYPPIKSADFDPATGQWSGATTVSDPPGPFTASMKGAVALRGSELIVAWSDNRQDGGDIRARRRVSSGGGVDHFAYSYDGLNRLTSVSGPVAESFTLDSGSNIGARTGPSATYAYDTSNRLTSDGSQPFVWSGADRLTQRGNDTFAYDALGRLTSSTVGGIARTYTYNGDGLLASRTEGGNTTSFLWDVSVSPAALVQSGSDKVVHGLGPLYGVRGDATTYTFARDGLGSVRAELTSSGGVSRSFRYAAYGTTAQSSGGSPGLLGFAGELADPSGLIYLRARWYDPATGRFTTRDPVAGDANAPATMNVYLYAYANPTAFVDPSGKCGFLISVCVGAIVGAVTGAAGAISQGGTWQQVLTATAVGAVGGAVAGIPGFGTRMVVGAAIGAGSDLVGQLIVRPNLGEVNWGSVAGAALGGGLASFGANKTIRFGQTLQADRLTIEWTAALIGVGPSGGLPAIGGALWDGLFKGRTQTGSSVGGDLLEQTPGAGQIGMLSPPAK